MDDSDTLTFGSGRQGPDDGRPGHLIRLRRRPWTRSHGVRLAAVTALVTAGVAWWATSSPQWPTGCGVAGHPEWCAQASLAMTDRSMAKFVGDYCPGLSDTLAVEVSPQPLSRLGLADDASFALTSGAVGEGSEDALLGNSDTVAWVTRWVGGRDDGLVQVRCHGDSGQVSDLTLQAAQYESTIAALDDTAGRHIDFREVARSTTTSLARRQADSSFGYLACDTSGVDLSSPRVGAVFSCLTEVYAAEGKGAYQSSYRVTASYPYFRQGDAPRPNQAHWRLFSPTNASSSTGVPRMITLEGRLSSETSCNRSPATFSTSAASRPNPAAGPL